MKVKISRKKLYITALITAFLIFFHGFGKPHVLPWQGSLALKYPVEIEARDGRFIVADDGSGRIIFADSRGKVSKIIAMSELKPSFDVIVSIASDDKYLYLLGYDVKEGGIRITKEHIEKYSLRGRHIKTLYEQIPGQEILRMPCALSDVKISDGKLYFTEISDDRKTVAAYKISVCENGQNLPERICAFDSPDDIICGENDVKNHTLIVTNQFNEVWQKRWNDGKAVVAKDESSFFPVDSKYMAKALKAYREAAISAENTDEELTPYNFWCRTEQNADGSNGKIYLLRYRHNSISCYDTAKDNLTVYDELPVSFAVWLKGVAYWLSVLLLAFVLLKLLYTQLKKGLTNGMKYTAAIIAVSAIIIGFYSNALYSQLLEQYRMRITVLCQSVLNYAEKNAGEFICNPDRANVQSYCRGKLQRDSVSAVAREIATLAGQAGEKDSFFVETYIFGENGQLYALGDSMRFLPAGAPISKELTNYYLSNSIDNRVARYYKSKNAGWLEDEDDAGKYLSRCITERDMHGNVSLMVLSSCCIDNLRTRAVGKAVETFINLLAFLIVLFVSVTLFTTLKTNVRTYMANKDTNNEKAAMALVAPYSALVYALQNIDMVIFILVSAQLSGGSAAKLAIPALFASIGATVGKVLQILFSRIYRNKTLIVFSTAIMAVSCIVTAFAVNISSIMLFAWAQFAKNLCLHGFMKAILYKMSFACKDEKLKRETEISYFTGKNAGTIIALFAGGYIGTLFDYKAVYLISATLAGLLALLFASTYRDCEPDEKKEASFTALASGLNLFAILFRPEMLQFIVCIMLLKASICVYPEKIFPLFATASQMSLLLLSNLTMFVKAANYVFAGKINMAIAKLDIPHKTATTYVNIITGLLFIAFWLNSTILWAIIILFALDIINDTGTICCGLYVASVGEKYSVSGSDMAARTEMIYGLGIVISAALVPLLAFGYENACGIIGVLYIAAALIFKMISGKTEENC